MLVNGIDTDRAWHLDDMQKLADASGTNVVGIRNSTRGFLRDLVRCAGDKLGVGNHAPVQTVAFYVQQAVARGEPLHLVGHSQGVLIIKRALTQVSRQLQQEGWTRPEIESRFGVLHIETHATVVTRFPHGPRYVHHVNTRDPISRALGLSLPRADPGGDARVIRFETPRPSVALNLKGGVGSAVMDALVSIHGAELYFANRTQDTFER